jgi:hypothetical protein
MTDLPTGTAQDPRPDPAADRQPVFTLADLEGWVARGLITPGQHAAIITFLTGAPPAVLAAQPVAPPRERPHGFNLVTVAYYFGAFLVLLAYTIFIGLQWERLGHAGQTLISLFTTVVLCVIGAFLRRRSYPTAGNLLVFAGTGVVPLVVYSALNWAGVWPESPQTGEYHQFYETIHGNWVILEVVSIAAALLAIWWTRFPLISLLAAFWGWYLSMDIARLLTRAQDRRWGEPEWIIGALFGTAMLALGIWLQRRRGDMEWSRWLYLFGHLALLGNLGALALDIEGAVGALFLLVYLAVVVASVVLQSRMWLVFGAIGCYSYVARLAFEVFAGSLGFVFALAAVGLLIVLATVAFQRFIHPWLQSRVRTLASAENDAGKPGIAGR